MSRASWPPRRALCSPRSVRCLPARCTATPDSNAWAADGPKVAGGGAMLAGDPHLPQTLPSVWYQVAMSAPGIAVSGVSVPGLPGVLLGHNKYIAWSLTDVQNQSALFYDEQTSKSHPGEYFWRGQWRRMRQVRYTIPVRGSAAQSLTVDLTVHGPVLTRAGQTVSVDWMGSIPSPDIAVMYDISKATDFAQFRAALASWRAPTQNFVFADEHGNIGAISAGYYPLVRHGDPWLPMPGTGADDVAGVIPYAAVPHVYDPPGHVVVTANQRPVGARLPVLHRHHGQRFRSRLPRQPWSTPTCDGHTQMTPASFAALQTSVTDQLAGRIVPLLRAALRYRSLSPDRSRPTSYSPAGITRCAGSAAASIWWTFWTDYLSAVFKPWWTAQKVPVHSDPSGLSVSAGAVQPR